MSGRSAAARNASFEAPEKPVRTFIALMRPTSTAAARRRWRVPAQTIGAMAEAGEKVDSLAEECPLSRWCGGRDLDELNQLADQLHQASLPDSTAVEKIYFKSNALKAMGQTFGLPAAHRGRQFHSACCCASCPGACC